MISRRIKQPFYELTKSHNGRGIGPRGARQILQKRRYINAEGESIAKPAKENGHREDSESGSNPYPLPKSSCPKKKNNGRNTRKKVCVPSIDACTKYVSSHGDRTFACNLLFIPEVRKKEKGNTPATGQLPHFPTQPPQGIYAGGLHATMAGCLCRPLLATVQLPRSYPADDSSQQCSTRSSWEGN